ncbi:hypothetical protein ACJJTC_011543 [Scirpophaga incertulas]
MSSANNRPVSPNQPVESVGSSTSSATIKARKAAAQALFSRRQLERAEELAEIRRRELEELAEKRRITEEQELQAELAAIDADASSRKGSRRGSVVSGERTERWVETQSILMFDKSPAADVQSTHRNVPPSHLVLKPVAHKDSAAFSTQDETHCAFVPEDNLHVVLGVDPEKESQDNRALVQLEVTI